MTVSDDILIEAFLTESTVSAAAERAGMSTRTAYRRLADKTFSEALQAARKDCFTAAVASLHGKYGQMLRRLEHLAEHGKTENIRLQAIKVWVDAANKRHEADIEAALFQLEQDKQHAVT